MTKSHSSFIIILYTYISTCIYIYMYIVHTKACKVHLKPNNTKNALSEAENGRTKNKKSQNTNLNFNRMIIV